MVHQALVMAAKGAGVYTLAPHQALVRARARPSIPTHHGSNSMGQARTPTLMALGGNYLCKSEDKKGKAAQEPTMKSNFETAAGRGVYTSRFWRKGCHLLHCCTRIRGT